MALTGLMQDRALTMGALMDHAARNHGAREVIGRNAAGALVRSSWGEVAARARKVAAALGGLGLEQGDRVATLAWNRIPHLELYFGVTAAGLVLHTVNPRLYPEQLVYILNHGGAKVVCVDPDLLGILEGIADQLAAIETIVVLSAAKDIPESGLRSLVAYEDWIAATQPLADWPELDEKAAAILCYTSGTTGNPKGVLYSHRSTLLHAMSACSADSMAMAARDNALLVTPLFHVNAWGVPFAAAMAGAKLVLPGSQLDPASILTLLEEERITFSLGVPTVWLGFAAHYDALPAAERPQLALQRVFMGGAATPRSLIDWFDAALGVDVLQAWGMTETSPVATVCRPLVHQLDLPREDLLDLKAMQGRPMFGVEIRVRALEGEGEAAAGASGHLQVRGLWVLSAYFGQEPGSALDPDGWFDTGDIARITPDGFLQITDRAKDVIKSGGEWISSIDLEDAAQAHAAVAEAAVIGVPHPKWQERPLMLVRLHSGASCESAELLEHLTARVARWWLPDEVLFVADLPHTGTGKLLKTTLRAEYEHFYAERG
ncbi:MAG: hypothetical protein RL702_1085 [Pseudomonadota bacterium]|jgi:fatty-acyl-CoA synthase